MLIRKGTATFGTMNIPERKKPVLVIGKENSFKVYGTFMSKEAADLFMEELCSILGVSDECKK